VKEEIHSANARQLPYEEKLGKLLGFERENVDLRNEIDQLNFTITQKNVIIESKDFEDLHKQKLILEEKNQELFEKLNLAEERYLRVDKTLVEFQDKYLEEKKKHAALESTLLKLEEKSEKSSSDRLDSLNGSLPVVTETQDLEKLEEVLSTNEQFKLEINKLTIKIESLENELASSRNQYKVLDESHGRCVEKYLNLCYSINVTIENVQLQLDAQVKKCSELENELKNNESCVLELKQTKEVVNNLTAVNDVLKVRESELESEIRNLTEKLTAVETQRRLDQETISLLEKNIQELKDNINTRAENNAHALGEVMHSQALIENLSEQLITVKEENLKADEKLAKLQARLDESTSLTENLEKVVINECERFKNEGKTYSKLLAGLGKLNGDVQEAKEEVADFKSSLMSSVRSCQSDYDGLRKDLLNAVEEFAAKLMKSNSELLSEMNMMNQVCILFFIFIYYYYSVLIIVTLVLE